MRLPPSQHVRFLIVGASAFFLGAGLLKLGTVLGGSPYLAQFPALGAAVLYTWYFNRRWTFAVQDPPSLSEFGRYLLATAAGLATNAAGFSMLLYAGTPLFPAFAGGTLLALGVNFIGYRFFAFRT